MSLYFIAGGYVFITTGIALLTRDKDIVEEMARLEEENLWRQLARNVVKQYWIDEDGLSFVFQITKEK